ncbi:RDD family protein [Rubripirellula tenax]|uniref:RDD family protein n=2 Tax=Rubripirellula tenax TaxID=2528015 RepID=A0A5C6EM75_9BACT|nr:RDD family protein [Rubripirellula tenax]
MFDELTDGDLQPVRAVPQPGRSAPTGGMSAAGGKLLNQYGSTTDRSAAVLLGANPNFSIASVGKRISGSLLDGVFSMVGMALGFGLMLAVYAVSGVDEEQAGEFSDPGFWAFMVGAIIPPIINAVLVSMSGQTLGKKLVGTVIVNEATGAPVGFTQGILQRTFVFGIFTGLPLIGIFVALADVVYLFIGDHQTLHDKYAKTYVVNA